VMAGSDLGISPLAMAFEYADEGALLETGSYPSGPLSLLGPMEDDTGAQQ
jgi:hypothetical protein